MSYQPVEQRVQTVERVVDVEVPVDRVVEKVVNVNVERVVKTTQLL